MKVLSRVDRYRAVSYKKKLESKLVEYGLGVMPPHTGRRCRQNQDEMQGPTYGPSVGEFSTLRVRDPADAENWLNMLEKKCFDVMNCPEERKTFRGILEDKYYPNTYCKAKRDEFLGLKQGSLSVAEYERKYTELSRYADVIVASESDRCRRFERGLHFEIRTPVTAIAK
ncbi:uncharacterized protein E5676_scaffold1737G001590 [Cucumis melo var. makuwa]|uniref:Retrotransposon gag domain-containing protein n=1 Tax=Cucumis melo var. makuwa TaxID=1194695 RepID=A0A5A7U448_CUCMM|nr:uncharacterized protein E6C27_scaffold673G00420 [Cucumis melo var. makuwa]TYK07858.1 uncharacterized protein E5676_scaffold1737G001590 [Cucumis melo var. makuwa]